MVLRSNLKPALMPHLLSGKLQSSQLPKYAPFPLFLSTLLLSFSYSSVYLYTATSPKVPTTLTGSLMPSDDLLQSTEGRGNHGSRFLNGARPVLKKQPTKITRLGWLRLTCSHGGASRFLQRYREVWSTCQEVRRDLW